MCPPRPTVNGIADQAFAKRGEGPRAASRVIEAIVHARVRSSRVVLIRAYALRKWTRRHFSCWHKLHLRDVSSNVRFRGEADIPPQGRDFRFDPRSRRGRVPARSALTPSRITSPGVR